MQGLFRRIWSKQLYCTAHPTWYPNGEEESIIREMIDMLLTTVSVKKFREATAIMMSCKRSIKANHYLNEAQARMLLERFVHNAKIHSIAPMAAQY